MPLGKGILESDGVRNRSGRRVLLVGWYGAQNFGDELMLKCMIDRYKAIANSDEIVEVSVLIEDNPYYRFSNIPDNIRCFYPPENDEDVVFACSYFDEIVLGGGAHIDDRDRKRLDFIPYLMVRLSLEALRQRKIVRWVAASSNRKLSDADYIKSIRFIAERSASFSVRDTFSLEVLKKVGVQNVLLERDIAFDIETYLERFNRTAFVVLTDFVGEEFLCVFLNDLFSFFNSRKQMGERWRICFLPFYLERSADRKLYRKLLKKVDSGGLCCFVAEEIENVETMLMLFTASDMLISMRYHASLIANVVGVPNLSVCPDSHRHYFNKMHALSEEFPMSSRLLDVSEYSIGLLVEYLYALVNMKKASL